jgi:hypothetical protein
MERWLKPMPECLRPFEEEMVRQGNPDLHAIQEVLGEAYPAAQEQVLALFGWFGSGAGPWSGFPSYESVPERLLLFHSTLLLVETLKAATPTDRQWIGAARYFAGWEFGRTKKSDRRLLPG